jgi:hypothetical protein
VSTATEIPAGGVADRAATYDRTSAAAIATEAFLIHRGLIAAAIVVAAVAVVAESALMQAQLRGIRQDLRDGGGTA